MQQAQAAYEQVRTAVIEIRAALAASYGISQLAQRSRRTRRAADSTTQVSVTGKGHGTNAAATGWLMGNNVEGTSTSQLMSGSGPHGGMMIHVCAPFDSGIYQTFTGAGNHHVRVTVTIKVASGEGFLGVGTGGGSGGTQYIDPGGWHTITWTDTDQIPATEIIIYSIAAEPATSCYDVDSVIIQAIT